MTSASDALQAILTRHEPGTGEQSICGECNLEHPCPTARLAQKGLLADRALSTFLDGSSW